MFSIYPSCISLHYNEFIINHVSGGRDGGSGLLPPKINSVAGKG